MLRPLLFHRAPSDSYGTGPLFGTRTGIAAKFTCQLSFTGGTYICRRNIVQLFVYVTLIADLLLGDHLIVKREFFSYFDVPSGEEYSTWSVDAPLVSVDSVKTQISPISAGVVDKSGVVSSVCTV